jgi:transposase InsO family protein
LDPETYDFLHELLQSTGPDIGIPTLRGLLPGAARGALERHLRVYRLGHRRRRRARLYQLNWRHPGAVWAIDLANPYEPVDGQGRVVLAVRDLASRFTVGWIALARGSCREVSEVIERLMRRNGAPLVLKSDNGSPFTGVAFKSTLARFGVVHLRSPHAWPQYNGACEAGIGVLKALTDTAAAGRGDPEYWSSDDLEEARARANELSRRIEKRQVSAEKEWRLRTRILATQRRRLRLAIARHTDPLRTSESGPRSWRLRRKAIQEALRELGFLEVTSRWVRARSRGAGSTPSYR